MANKTFLGLGVLPALILISSSTPFLYLGVRGLLTSEYLVNNSNETQGVVIEHKYRYVPDPEGGSFNYVFYDPIVEFTTHRGEEVTFIYEINVDPPIYEVGDSVEILYDPRNASQAIIRSWDRLWKQPVEYLVVGFIPFVVLIPWGIWTRKKRMKS
ncbi:MAG: DUF3592 domain-containing protein [Anaerolineales bacterium]|nr:MAG: DUF3592 domain-containing protein [Anaerolineales bacterium]